MHNTNPTPQYSGDFAANQAAHILLDSIPQEASTPGVGITADHVPAIADLLQRTVAHVISGLLNAGSERDAVMENTHLANALQQELRSWVVQ